MRKAFALALMVAACREERPPAPTAEQSAQLNEAEALLNAEAEKEEGPAPAGTSPSNRSD